MVDTFEQYLLQPAFARMWGLVRAKYERLGRVGGTVELTALSIAENDALAGLLARNLYGKTAYTVRLRDLDEALQASRFHATLVDALRLLFPDLRTRLQQMTEADAAWRAYCKSARDSARHERVGAWVEQLAAGEGSGYRAFVECFNEFCALGHCAAWIRAIGALDAVAAELESPAVRFIQPQRTRLPVFAATTTGDPHGLDRNTLAGKVFYWGLNALFDAASEEDGRDDGRVDESVEASVAEDDAATEDAAVGAPSERVRWLYAQAGILLDDISSAVWVGNWPGFYVAPVAVPLLTLETRAQPLPAVEAVYVVENPSVFADLIECAPSGVPMVCTSGQPSVAALRLLDMAVTAGATLYYSGDFDVKGLQMASALRDRHRNRLVPWRMDVGTYQAACSDKLPGLSAAEVTALRAVRIDWDDDLVAVMAATGHKVFQEHILPQLKYDVQEISYQ